MLNRIIVRHPTPSAHWKPTRPRSENLPEGLDLGALGDLAGKVDLGGITEGLGDMLGGLFGKK